MIYNYIEINKLDALVSNIMCSKEFIKILGIAKKIFDKEKWNFLLLKNGIFKYWYWI